MGFTWLPMDTGIVVVGALCAAACALPGCFLVLRQMSMMGDAISHAVLPGLAGGFLLMVALRDASWVASISPALAEWFSDADARHPMVMFLGAAIVGVLTAVFTQWINSFGRVDRGAAMGIVFTTLFAIGLLLIVRAADYVDLDADCVLYGAIETTPLDQLTVGAFGVRFEMPWAAAEIGVVLLMNLAIIVVLFKELKLSSFDPELATTLGINANVMHYLLMTMTAITAVAAFEAVGSIIVIAMLIVPPATAYLLTDRLGMMLVLSVVIGVVAAPLGHVAALTLPPLVGFRDTNSAGMMAAALGVLFALVWLFSPRHGVVARRFHRKAAASG